MELLFLLVPALLFGLWFFWLTRDRDGSHTRTMLRRKFMAGSSDSEAVAAADLREGLSELERQHPNRSGVWRLRKLISQQRK